MSTQRSMTVTETQQAELEALAALPDEKIDTTALPEQTDWSGARRGVLFPASRGGSVRAVPA